MAVAENVTGGFWECTKTAQNIGSWIVEGPKHLFSDVDATADLLMLVQRVHSIFEPFIQIMPLKRIAEAVTSITDFVSARSFIGGIHDIISGKAAWEKPFSVHFPDVLKVASKLVFLVGNCMDLASWLSSFHVLGEWVKSSTAQIVTWGKEFNILQGIGDVTCITGALLNIADTIRLILQEALTDGYFKNGSLKLSVLTDHLIDIAYDISSIAASVLSNIPGVPVVMTTVSLAVGSTLSLGRFFKGIYWKEPEAKDLKV
jgi:hypothetical protein